jgi:hypothetical protein
MRKKLTTLMIIFFMLSVCFSQKHISYAVDTADVSTAYDAIEETDDNNYIIPIYIMNNSGIMGFKIMLSYDSTKIKISAVTRGIVTSGGNFYSDLDMNNNSGFVNVLWNTTENIKDDGSLMYLTVTLLDSTVSAIELDVAYSGEDTFNEAWQDVVLNCYDIAYKLDVDDGNSDAEENTEDGEYEETEAVSDSEYEQLPVVPDEIVNNEAEQEYIDLAKEALGEADTAADIGNDKIKNSITRVLKQYGVYSINDVPEEQEEEFWEAVRIDLRDIEGVDEDKIDELDISKIAENIVISTEEIDEADISVQPVNKPVDNNSNNKVIVPLIIIFILVVVVIIVVITKRRKQYE